MKKIILIVLLVTFGVAAGHFDIDKEKLKLSNRVFDYYDKDKSKTLSFKEFILFLRDVRKKEQEKRLNLTLKRCDKNKDGKIGSDEVPTEEELDDMFRERKRMDKVCVMNKRIFEAVDRNKDNFVTRDEILLSFEKPRVVSRAMRVSKRDELKDFKRFLKRCDKNKDGAITLIEATDQMCFMSSDIFLQYSKDPKKSFKIAKITHTPKYNDKDEVDHMFLDCDKDRDKHLNLIEATSKWCHLTSNDFLRLDKDKDKLLNKEELSKMFAPRANPKKFIFKNLKNMPDDIKMNIAFHQCDSNKDGIFTQNEAKKCEFPMNIFKKFDYDKSKTIEQSDVDLIRKHREFERVDMNSDKKIDKDEFAQRMGSRCRIF